MNTENCENPSTNQTFGSPRKDKKSFFTAKSPSRGTTTPRCSLPAQEARSLSLPSEPSKDLLKSKTKMKKELSLMYLRNNALEQAQVEFSTSIDELQHSLRETQTENLELRSRVEELKKKLNSLEHIEQEIEKERWRKFCNRH